VTGSGARRSLYRTQRLRDLPPASTASAGPQSLRCSGVTAFNTRVDGVWTEASPAKAGAEAGQQRRSITAVRVGTTNLAKDVKIRDRCILKRHA
jgi:hypothetical protein